MDKETILGLVKVLLFTLVVTEILLLLAHHWAMSHADPETYQKSVETLLINTVALICTAGVAFWLA
jgi:hypothetical protein